MACSYPVSAGLVWLADYLTSREGNPDMVNTINPADCKPGEVYEGTVHGLERTVLVRRDSADSYPWESLGEVLDHEDVSDLVRLVPARPVTHQDLLDDPDDRWETFKSRFKEFDGYRSEAHQHSLWTVFRSGIQYAETRMLDHLNANGVVPVPVGRAANNMLRETLANVERDRDRLRRAHEIVEQERDQARDSLRSLRGAHSRLTRDYRHLSDRAEAAESSTAPAVTHADIEKVIDQTLEKLVHGDWIPTAAADAVWSLVSGDDPAVFVVRESDLPEVWRDNKHNLMGEFCRHWWTGDGDWAAHQDSDAREARALIPNYLRKIAGWEATARAIEAEAGRATDPVEELAGQIESATRAAIRQVCVDLADVVPSLDPLAVERAMEVAAASRKVAAHVLGREAGDE